MNKKPADTTGRALAAGPADRALPAGLEPYGWLAHLPGIVWCWRVDADGRLSIPFASPSLTDYCGLAPAAVTEDASLVLDCLHPDDAQRVRDLLQPTGQSAPWQADIRIHHPQRGERWLEWRAQPAPETEGCRLWSGCAHDITDRKRAAAELRRGHERLALAQRLAGIGIWEWDLRKGTQDWSPEFFRLLGLEPAAAEPGFATWRQASHSEDVLRIETQLDAAVQDRRPLDLEFRVLRPDGEVRWRQLLGNVLLDHDGNPLCLTGICLDISSRKEAEEALRESDRRKDQFLAILAHELRNPLAPIRNGLRILRRAAADPAVQERTHAMLDRQILHMVRLIDDLLDLSRISRGKLVLRREPVDLADVLEDAVTTSRPLIDQAGLRMEVVLPAEPLPMDADPTRLAQVFANLLNNAAKFSERGGCIQVSAWREAALVKVCIRDDGIGIRPEMLARIFEMFVQAEDDMSRFGGGLGIGLSLARRITVLHGGQIEARSDGPGQGAEFLVSLPLAAAALSALPPFSLPAPPIEPQFGRREPQPERQPPQGGKAVAGDVAPGPLVLVVDDNEDAAISLAALIDVLGAEVLIGHDGLEAVELAERYRPDLVLLDIGMPRMNGHEACRKLRELPFGPDMLIVALTGWGQSEDFRRSREAGFDRHLVKPVDPLTVEALLFELAPTSRRTSDAAIPPSPR
jgi:PAS domain S-box-containing protein